ncbi:hypothetical protein NC653_024008 [Populus alba x Populus x berolinensis]|uniref:Uncharacterized protein n=1 Tax=Populus alba x Populus x berolinensis TaxID=444605 RepID=A0AAD6QBN6_9ROSI|nr:hypothetical protein NC653_024008 [Populus alba x Populus x berolinensis]
MLPSHHEKTSNPLVDYDLIIFDKKFSNPTKLFTISASKILYLISPSIGLGIKGFRRLSSLVFLVRLAIHFMAFECQKSTEVSKSLAICVEKRVSNEKSWKELFVEREYRSKIFLSRYSIDTLHGHTEAVRTVFSIGFCQAHFYLWAGGQLRVSSTCLTLKVLRCQTLNFRIWEHEGPITSLALDPTRIYSGSWDMTVRIWDRSSLECIKILRHGDWVWSLVPHDTTVASTSGNTYSLARSHTGDFIFTGGEDGAMHMFEITGPKPEANVFKMLVLTVLYVEERKVLLGSGTSQRRWKGKRTARAMRGIRYSQEVLASRRKCLQDNPYHHGDQPSSLEPVLTICLVDELQFT